MNQSTEKCILVVGAGNMGCSIAKGLISKDWQEHQFIFCEQLIERHALLANTFPGSTIIADFASLEKTPDIILLAVKPNDMHLVCKQLAERKFSSTLFISIAAGVPVSVYLRWLGDGTTIVRCMPNTPAAIGAGITGLYTPSNTSSNDKNIASEVLSAIGKIVWVEDESLINVVTAISGSGPAYLFYFMECMQASGEALGLSAAESHQLTLQTMLGAAQLADSDTTSFQQLRENVTSKGGTTEQAIKCFEHNKTQQIIDQAVKAAANKASDISNSFDNEE